MVRINELIIWWAEYREVFIEKVYPWTDGRTMLAWPDLMKKPWSRNLADSLCPLNDKFLTFEQVPEEFRTGNREHDWICIYDWKRIMIALGTIARFYESGKLI